MTHFFFALYGAIAVAIFIVFASVDRDRWPTAVAFALLWTLFGLMALLDGF